MPASPSLLHALDYADRWLAYRRWRLRIPGVQVAVRIGGELVLERAHGVADASTGEALTPAHRFRIASHSKALAAIATMRLVDDGRLRLDDEAQLHVPALDAFKAVTEPTAEGREISTTQAYVRVLTTLLRDKELGPRVVPILVDEARTFGMEGLFRQIGIYSSVGQLYTPQDSDQLMSYKEDKKGQMLEEGINEAGSLCSWIAAGTAYANHKQHMVPFYIYYSMFGFQRVGDAAWQAGDMRARGFLLGGTSGRTTLNGEGLQHEDGHSHVHASVIPNCRSYDPTFAYEVAVIVQDGLRRMYAEQEDVYYYITTLNENYAHPAMPEGAEEGIKKGLYLLEAGPPAGKGKAAPRVQLLGCGSILREVIAAASLLRDDLPDNDVRRMLGRQLHVGADTAPSPTARRAS